MKLPIRVEGLIKSYGPSKGRVLDDVGFELEPGKYWDCWGQMAQGKPLLSKSFWVWFDLTRAECGFLERRELINQRKTGFSPGGKLPIPLLSIEETLRFFEPSIRPQR